MSKKHAYGIPAYNRIRDWLMYDGDPKRPSAPVLLDSDHVIYDRLQTLRSLLTQKAYSYQGAMPIMIKTYQISEATYWRDVRGLRIILGDLEDENRAFEKHRLKELAMMAYQMAMTQKDNKGMTQAVKNLIILNGLDREEDNGIDPEKLNPGMYALVLDEAAKGFFNHLLEGQGSVNLSNFTNPQKEEYAEAEVISDDDGGVDQSGDSEA